MEIIVLPNHLYLPACAAGIDQPLESIAEALDEADKLHHALTIREAKTIIDTFYKVCVFKTHELYIPPQ